MKQTTGALLLAMGMIACGDGNTGNRTHDMPTVTDTATNAENMSPINDTTPTTNNNAYNPDSAAGRGTTYDTAARRDSAPQ